MHDSELISGLIQTSINPDSDSNYWVSINCIFIKIMPNLRGNTSAKKRRRQNKVQRAKKKIEFNVSSHSEEQFQSCDATEPVVVSNTVECNDGSVFDNNKESCDAVEPKVVSAINDILTPKER